MRDFIARLIFFFVASFAALFCMPLASHAAQEDEGKGIETLSQMDEICVCITGESFSYVRDEGLLTIKGGVRVSYSDFVLECDTLELISDGREKPVIRAYPDVSMDFANGLAEFTGSEFRYDFNTREGGFGSTTGIFHIDPDKIEMGIDMDVPIDVRFKADSLALSPDRIVLDGPRWSAGSRESGELEFHSDEIVAEIDEEGRIVAASMDHFDIRLFGVKVTLLPMRLRQGFIKRNDVGFTGFLPTMTYDASDGLGIDQKFFYTFSASEESESFISIRLNPYIPDRFYWQVGLNQAFPGGRASLLYGPERLEDPLNEGQVVWSEPDFRLRYSLPRIGDYSHGITGFYGDIREASRNVERERGGFDYEFALKAVEFGNWAVKFNGAYVWSFYEGGQDYAVFKSTTSLIYDGGSDFDWKLSYINNNDEGESPFMYDRVEVSEGLHYKGQVFPGKRWGIASDLLYDLDRDNFKRLGFGGIYVFDTMEIGVLWDFEQKTVRLLIGLPKQFV